MMRKNFELLTKKCKQTKPRVLDDYEMRLTSKAAIHEPMFFVR